MSETETFPLIDVLIDTERGSTTLSDSVPRHEIEVLRAVHGFDKVHEIGKSDDEIELSANADAEWARLTRKYQRINAPDPVPLAFRTGPSGLKAHGFEVRGNYEPAPQSGVRKHPKPVKGGTRKSSKAA